MTVTRVRLIEKEDDDTYLHETSTYQQEGLRKNYFWNLR